MHLHPRWRSRDLVCARVAAILKREKTLGTRLFYLRFTLSAILFHFASAVISYPDLLDLVALAAILNTSPSSLKITWSAVCQGLLPSRRHIEKRGDPGDEVGPPHFPRAGNTAANHFPPSISVLCNRGCLSPRSKATYYFNIALFPFPH